MYFPAVDNSVTVMGSGKKEANRKVRQGKTGDGMSNVKMKGENFYRYDQLFRGYEEQSKG